MRKKFLSALILGAFTVATTSTIVSCKDYDDDIAALQLKDKNVDQQIATINTALDGLKQADKDLAAAIESGDKATLAAAQAAVATAQATLEQAIAKVDAKVDNLNNTLSAAIAKAQGAAEAAQAAAEKAQATADVNTANIAKVAQDLATANTKLSSLDSRVTAAETQIGLLDAALKAQEAALTAETNARTEAINKLLTETIPTLKQELETADANLQANINNLDTKYTNEVNRVQGLVENLSTQISEINPKLNVINDILSGDLRSLVFMPYVYVDGIEAIAYPGIYIEEFLHNGTSTAYNDASPEYVFNRPARFAETIDPQNNDGPSLKVAKGVDYVINKHDLVDHDNYYLYLPEIGVDYHMNPATAKTAWEDILRFVQRDTRYTETTTRAIVDDDLVYPVYNNQFSDYQHFKNEKGILSVGMVLDVASQYAKDQAPVKLTSWFNTTNATRYAEYEAAKQSAWDRLKGDNPDRVGAENYIAALQAKTSMGADATVTSDYAQVYGEDLYRLSISWSKKNDRLVKDPAGAQPTTDWDEECEGKKDWGTLFGSVSTFAQQAPSREVFLASAANHQIFDNPKDALLASASVFVPYDGAGVSLGEYIQTCFDRKGSMGGRENHVGWKFKEEEKFGFHYVFNIVKYEHLPKNLNDGSGANTGADVELDSDYAKLKGDTIYATAKGGATPATETAIGREPLVQVLLMHGDHVVKDAYILCRITGDPDATIGAITYPEWSITFNNCDDHPFVTPLGGTVSGDKCADWYNLMLSSNGLLKGEFDFLTFNGLYEIDRRAGGANDGEISIFTTDAEEGHVNESYYEYTKRDGVNKNQIATITLDVLKRDPSLGHTDGNYERFSYKTTIDMTADQLEAISHDQDTDKKTYDLYIRWNAKSVRAPYKHIYVKYTIEIQRFIQQVGINEKNDNYWYGLDGNNAGWDAMAFNVDYPLNNTYPIDWLSHTDRAFVNQNVTFDDASLLNKKYFFVPQNTEITDLEGTTWIITPASGDEDLGWKTLPCAKDIYNSHIWPLTEEADAYYSTNNGKSVTDVVALKNLMLWCNIAYNEGAFTNDDLYAVKKADYHNGDPLFTKKYIKIAHMESSNGDIKLVRDKDSYDQSETWSGDDVKCAEHKALDMVLNAIGYKAGHANITTELHSWVGVVAKNDCQYDVVDPNDPRYTNRYEVAVYTFDKFGVDNNKNFGIWTASWQRPINLVNDKPKDEYNAVKDAQSNGYYIPVYDLLSFYDWRGPVEGDMEGNNKWLWAYYNINRIEVDCNPDHVTTTINGGSLETTTLGSVTGQVRLYPATAAQHNALQLPAKYTFNTLIGRVGGNYNSANLNENLLTYLEGSANGKANFGYIFYENNGLNVTQFTVRIPLVIYYEWGHFKTYTDVVINTTLGN
jgi:archaellum component FlaC